VLWGAVQAGAAGFVLKDAPADDLIHAVRSIAEGGSWLDPRVTPRLLAVLQSSAAPADRSRPSAFDRLTQRELEVLELIARGQTNIEIAAELYLSERTVKGHVSSIFSKVGARDRAAAIVLAYDAGFITPRPPAR